MQLQGSRASISAVKDASSPREFADMQHFLLRPGGKGLTILSQQGADSRLLRGWEAKQRKLQSFAILRQKSVTR